MNKEFINSPCRVSVENLRTMAENAISYIERNPEPFASTWEDFFSACPEGDFNWDDGEAGDWIPSLDEEEWIQTAYSLEISRKGSLESIVFKSVDTNGEWDVESEFETTDGKLDKISEREFSWETAISNNCLYSLLKMELYNLYVAETGLDPLDNTIGSGSPRKIHSKDIAFDIPELCVEVYKRAAEFYKKNK